MLGAMNSSPPTPPARKSNNTLIVVIIIAAVAIPMVLAAAIGVFAALGIYGSRRYLTNAKSAEGRANVTAIARAAVRASEELGTLPASAAPVPARLSMVSGKKYMSLSSDWEQPGWKELGFNYSTPQYFQYSWERVSVSEGTARAVADLNGDGAPDTTLEIAVSCTGTPPVCSPGGVIEKN